MTIDEIIIQYADEYSKKYPDSDPFWLYSETFSDEKIVEIFEQSKGRKVIFELTDNADELNFHYEEF
jgi:hypothetical protein